MIRSGDRMARLVLKATSNLPRLLSASQLGITLASLGLGALTEETLSHYFEAWVDRLPFAVELSIRVALGSVFAIGLVTYFHVVFGELAPRSVALTHPERVARLLSPPLSVFEWLMRPFAIVLNRSAELALRLFGQHAQSMEESLHSPEELRILVEQSQEAGVLESTDAN